MLKDLNEIGFDEISQEERLWNSLSGNFLAIDMETGAFLVRSDGRSKSGRAPRFWLFLPVKFERQLLFSYRNASADYRAEFRSGSIREAIEIANQKLPRLIKKLEKDKANAVH